MAYTPINWENLPSTKTPINAENLKHMDEGIAQAHDAIRLLELYKANSIKKTLSGEVITSKDCAQVPPLGIKLFGKGTQKIVPGNQLFDASKLSTVTVGNVTITNNSDGSFTLSGSGELTENVNYTHMYSHEETMELLKEGTLNLAGSVVYPYLFTALYYGNMANSRVMTLDINTQSSIEILTEYLDDSCQLQIGFYGNVGGTIKNGTIKPMLYQDGDGTWEPFVGGEPSPSMNYPQIPVFHGESGSIKGKVLNSNQFDVNKALETFLDANGRMYFKFINGETYTMSVDSKIADTSMNTLFCVSSNTWKNGVLADSRIYLTSVGRLTKTFTIPNDGLEYYLIPAVSGVPILSQFNSLFDGRCSENLQIELGEATTPYTPYTEQPFTVLTPNGLRGIPVDFGGNYVDSSYRKWVTDIIDYEYKTREQKIKEAVFDGSDDELWQRDSVGSECIAFYILIPDMTRTYKGYSTVLCDKLIFKDWDTYNSLDEEFISKTTVLVVRIKQERLESLDIAGFKKFLSENPITVWYELADPITTDPTAEELDQYNSLVMNYPITNVVNDAGACMEVEYVADTQLHIEQNYVSIDKYNEHENRIAEIEKAMVNS